MNKTQCWRILTRLLLAFALLLPHTAQAANTLKIVIPPIGKSSDFYGIYFPKMLALALTKTQATDGPFDIETYPDLLTVDRFLAEMKNDRAVNVVWTTIDKRRDRDFLAIKISLLKELNNYRIFLIRKQDQSMFSNIKTMDELRELKAGQGSQWPDTNVLRNNGFKVVTALDHDELFKMLFAKRFDYFPRGVYEIWNELQYRNDPRLAIEQNLMLYYESPFYFFVNKKNTALADRIERGLKIAIADGSFDALFFSIPGFKRGYEEQFNKQRKLFKLEIN